MEILKDKRYRKILIFAITLLVITLLFRGFLRYRLYLYRASESEDITYDSGKNLSSGITTEKIEDTLFTKEDLQKEFLEIKKYDQAGRQGLVRIKDLQNIQSEEDKLKEKILKTMEDRLSPEEISLLREEESLFLRSRRRQSLLASNGAGGMMERALYLERYISLTEKRIEELLSRM